MGDRISYLAKNTGYLAVGQLGTKFLSFFLVPLYTYVLTTSEYGTYDMFSTTVSLLVPILSLNISDASLRFPLDKKYDRRDVFSISLYHLLLCLMWGGGLIGLNILFEAVSIVNDYPLLLFLLLLATTANSIMNCFARGIDKVKEVAVSGVICSLVIVFLNLLFLLPLRMGLVGYFLANIFGLIGQCVYLFIAIKGWRYIKWGQLDKGLHKEMLAYSKPMILNNISWWVNGVSNRYVIVWLCGIAANGVFSVSYKIPSILMIFQGIFNQAWTLSAVHEFDKEDRNVFFSKMYASYNACMVLICSLLIVTSQLIASFLYAKDFFYAWRYVPFLLIATVFGSLCGYIGGIYAAVKDTKSLATTSVIGAGANLLLTLLLVWQIGVMGAAIAASVSYALAWYTRIKRLRKHMDLHISYWRDGSCYIILFFQSIFLLMCEDSVLLYVMESIFFVLLFLIQKPLLVTIYSKIVSKIRLK